MNNASTPPNEGGAADLLLERTAALMGADEPNPHAFHRLEQVLGGELARRLVGALSDRDDTASEPAA
jgi:hypothetical protein